MPAGSPAPCRGGPALLSRPPLCAAFFAAPLPGAPPPAARLCRGFLRGRLPGRRPRSRLPGARHLCGRREHTLRHFRGDVVLGGRARVVVVFLDEEPRLLALVLAVRDAHEVPAAVELLA